jgi:hypothetical protein
VSSDINQLDFVSLRQHSYAEAMEAVSRLFSSCDTKWPDFLLNTGINHLIDDLLQSSLHLRRMSEFSNKKIVRKIQPMDFGVKRDFSKFENDFWSAINRIIHHRKLEPIIFTQDDFYNSENKPMPGRLLADVKVESDRGISFINVAGFAVAATNELGELSVKPQKVFH